MYRNIASWMQLEEQYPMFILSSDCIEISNSETIYYFIWATRVREFRALLYLQIPELTVS